MTVLFEVPGSSGTDGARAAFAIFNGVFQAVREFVSVRQPELLVFATKQDFLAGIYRTYLKRERSALEQMGYTLEEVQAVEPYVEFTLRRIKPSEWR